MSQPEPDPHHPTPGMHIWGWMSPTELEWLYAQAHEMDSVVEIGCLHGRSSFALASGCPGRVYCIDPWNDPGWESWNASVGERFENVTGIREPSPHAGRRIRGKVDMVFIDGAHDYASVKADIDYWLPRTTKLLCGHDYVPDSELQGHEAAFPDVKRAVDDILGPVEVAPGTAIWTYTPKGG